MSDSTNAKTNTVVACFEDPQVAGRVIRSMRQDEGIPSERVGAVLADSPKARMLLEEGPGSPKEGAKVGSIVGATLFGLSAVAMTVPPIGLLAVGPAAALIGGGVTGATAGGLLGAFAGMGIPENEAALRAKEIEDGGVMVTVEGKDEAERARVTEKLTGAGASYTFRL